MSIGVELLSSSGEAELEELLQSISTSLLYASLPYRSFLTRILDGCVDRYFVARDGGRVVGLLPTFVRHNPTYGSVINSLPFVGSNGGVIVSERATDRAAVKTALMGALLAYAREARVVASTVIASPLEPEAALYEATSEYTHRDERVCQITPLPRSVSDGAAVTTTLLSRFHENPRRAIKKAQKSGVSVSHSSSLEALQTLSAIHEENMAATGGPTKPWRVFEAIRASFVYDRDYRVYVAEKDGTTVAALLVFFRNFTTEYFTPATLASARTFQPLSLLVFEAMQEAVRRGHVNWNWGGPGPAQPAIYEFKQRWGAVDHPYSYYVKVYDESVLGQTKAALLREYPCFYVAPFGKLAHEDA